MKKYIGNIMLMAAVALGASSCNDYPDAFVLADGTPTVHYIRYANSQVLIDQAYMGEVICIVGDNLCSVHELLFNDQKALLNTSFMTEHTLLAAVPNALSTNPTNKVYLVNKDKDTVSVDFTVLMPPPVASSLTCEYAKPGTEVTMTGNYLIELESIAFEAGSGTVVTADQFKEQTMTSIVFTVPEDAAPGKFKLTAPSGVALSNFMYMDDRGLITDFDGTTDVVPQGWNIKATYSDADGIDGQYVQLGPSTLDEDGGWNEDLKLPFWCGRWDGNPMGITEGEGVPICNIIDFTDYQNMGIKFELYIPTSNPWTSGAMQIVFVSAARCANDEWQNNTYIHAKSDDNPEGLDLCRALYRPWVSTGSFDTADQWITVTVPFSEFVYNADGTQGLVPLSGPEDFASLIIWPWSGGIKGTECTPIFRIDNIRAVPLK